MSDQGFPDLRAFLEQLRRDHDLITIDAEVDPRLEAAEIHRRVIAAGGPALLFTRARGAGFPLVTNLFGTPRRAALAFGQRPLRLVKRLVHLAETLLPPTPAKLWDARDMAGEALRIGLSRARRGPVTEVVTDDVRLDRLPAQAATVEVYRRLRWWGARFAVLPAAGDTPYEYAAALSSRLDGLAPSGRGARLGGDTVDQIRAIAETIVWISYRPVPAESSPVMPLQRSWYRLSWRLRWMLLVNFWKAFAAHFPFSRTHHNSGKEEE